MLFGFALLALLPGIAQDLVPMDLASLDPESRFDFLLGDWNIYIDDELSATAHAKRVLRNHVIRYEEQTTSGSYASVAMTNFDTEDRWSQSWVDTSGFHLFYHGGLRSGAMELIQTEPYYESNVQALVHPRQVFDQVSRNRFRWLWDISLDEGETWRNQDVRVFRRRGDPFEDHHPIYSPDGDWIAFDSTRDGTSDLFRMKADGSGVRRITDGPSEDRVPSFSPDGRWLAYQSTRDGETDIWITSVEGGKSRRLTTGNLGGSRPTWSPDGKRIAFTNWVNQDPPRILVVDASGGTPRELVSNGRVPSWSPDGTAIAFSSNRGENEDLYLIAPDGTNLRRVTHDPALDAVPSWTRDGDWIAFQSNPLGNTDIFIIRPDGSERFAITQTPFDAALPNWNGDGSRILFQGNANGLPEIFSTSLDGDSMTVTRLTFGADGSR